MKFFAVIFSLFVMVLTVIPCVDEPHNESVQKIEQSQNASHNHANNTDQCTPFCTCQCCSSPVLCTFSAITTSTFFILQRQYSETSVSFLSSHVHSFWQPPKIG